MDDVEKLVNDLEGIMSGNDSNKINIKSENMMFNDDPFNNLNPGNFGDVSDNVLRDINIHEITDINSPTSSGNVLSPGASSIKSHGSQGTNPPPSTPATIPPTPHSTRRFYKINLNFF